MLRAHEFVLSWHVGRWLGLVCLEENGLSLATRARTLVAEGTQGNLALVTVIPDYYKPLNPGGQLNVQFHLFRYQNEISRCKNVVKERKKDNLMRLSFKVP